MSSLQYNTTPLAIIYRQIIDDVLQNVHQDFEELGIDDSIIQELQTSWETKIAQARPVNFPPLEPIAEPYPIQAALPTSLSQNLGASNTLYRLYDERGRFLPNLQPGALANGIPQSMMDVYARKLPYAAGAASNGGAAAAGGGGGGEYASGGAAMLVGLAASVGAGLPKPGERTPQSIDAELVRRLQAKRRASQEANGQQQQQQQQQPELLSQSFAMATTDGSREASVPASDELSKRELERQERKKRRVENGRPFDDPDDEINSDLDDTEDEDDDNEQDDDNNLILCLYEKVTRTKNKWKCTLKDGVMTVNGKDMLFQKANGEFEW